MATRAIIRSKNNERREMIMEEMLGGGMDQIRQGEQDRDGD